RFEREIRLAAALQHPHIVPLLTAGSQGDLLYYVMPHIAGESLRARIAHERELPVGDTVRILRDVCDALAYAHGHGIVHRDVKPDNVLLSGKHALVTDFGVAKAVSSSSGATALTSLGMALGTPAYMAPEQAAGDPNVDHRADLYAVGALGYELLAGRPPFSGMSPQGLLAAQVTTTPDPVTLHRDSVPPALAAPIMRRRPAGHAVDRRHGAAARARGDHRTGRAPGGIAPLVHVAPRAVGRRGGVRHADPDYRRLHGAADARHRSGRDSRRERRAGAARSAGARRLREPHQGFDARPVADGGATGRSRTIARGSAARWRGGRPGAVPHGSPAVGTARPGPRARAGAAGGRQGRGARSRRSIGARLRRLGRARRGERRRGAGRRTRERSGRRCDHRGGGPLVAPPARAHRGIAQDHPRERAARAGDHEVARGAA